jgi:anti-sigma regulatory factor (Ser/Thr protein kinase)
MGSTADAVWHWALFYEDRDQYADGVLRFVTGALDADRPVFVAVPAANGVLLRDRLDGAADRVRFADMTQVGRNPNCIIPAIRAFVDEHRDRPVSFVGEPIWAGRTAAEIAEATRHEALINAAFDDAGAEVLCPYDVAGLAPDVLADAFRTHPELVDAAGRRARSEGYEDPHEVWQSVAALSPVPDDAGTARVAGEADLGPLRQFARGRADQLPAPRVEELVLAMTELATNSLRHGGGAADVRLWTEPGRMLCEIRDAGAVGDPLVGRRAPDPAATSGRGLWLVNQLCDLVQLHSGPDGTRVRITVAA